MSSNFYKMIELWKFPTNQQCPKKCHFMHGPIIIIWRSNLKPYLEIPETSEFKWFVCNHISHIPICKYMYHRYENHWSINIIWKVTLSNIVSILIYKAFRSQITGIALDWMCRKENKMKNFRYQKFPMTNGWRVNWSIISIHMHTNETTWSLRF